MNKPFATHLRGLVLVAVVLVSLGFATQARAATAAGASTPRAAVVTSFVAFRAGNVAKFCSVMNQKYLDLPKKWGTSCVSQVKRFTTVYPKEWATARKQVSKTLLSLIEHAKVKIKRDQATVSWSLTKKFKDGGTSTLSATFKLSQVNGRWLIDEAFSSYLITGLYFS